MTENNEMTAEERAALEAALEAEQARLEAEQARLEAEERARIEHENMLNSFPETTVFFNEIISAPDDVKKLGMWTKDPHAADSYGWIENNIDESELTFVPNSDFCGVYYLKGHEPPAETTEEKIARRAAEITEQVQELIDSTAHSRGYDNGVSCVSYEGDPDETFNDEAVAFKAWRGRCWRTCYNILNSVKAGTVAPEDVTDEYVLERLPVMEWPENE